MNTYQVNNHKAEVEAKLIASMKDEVARRRREFIMNDAIKQQVEQVSGWLITDDFPFLILCGGCGNGKTTMMRALANTVSSMALSLPSSEKPLMLHEVQATELARKMKYDYHCWTKLRDCHLLGIDDMGEEPTEVRSYGNYMRPIVELLEYRYDKLLPTVITTNLTPRQISEKYGQRIADRLCEVAEKVAFMNPSFRSAEDAALEIPLPS